MVQRNCSQKLGLSFSDKYGSEAFVSNLIMVTLTSLQLALLQTNSKYEFEDSLYNIT